MWHHAVDVDPEKMAKERRMMKIALARYARQPLLQWDDVESREIKAWYESLAELMSQEGARDTVED